jgi:gluconate 5-dehydrogenase
MIILAGGSGYLGGAILNHLLNRGIKVLNLSSKPTGKIHPNLYEIILDLVDTENLQDKLSSFCNSNIEMFEAIINCAGRSKRNDNTTKTDSRNWEKIEKDYENDVKIFWNLATYMIRNKAMFANSSHFIDIGSIWSHRIPFKGTYLDLNNEPDLSVILSKSIKRTLVRYLSIDFGSIGFAINQLTPGWFPKPGPKPRVDYIKGLEDRIPANRIGKPDDLLPFIDLMICKSSNYMNGSEIIVDGGFSIY